MARVFARRGRATFRIAVLLAGLLGIGIGTTLLYFDRPDRETRYTPGSATLAFPLGLYDVPMENLRAARAAGFGMAHLYDSRQSLTDAIRYLAAAQGAGLQVMQNMPSARLHDGDEFWIQWVSTLAAYDNLAWWYLPEEPRPSEREALRRLYEIVREYDPKGRPVAVYFGSTHLEPWCDMVDVILVPAYPEYHRAPRADVRAWIDIAREACPGKPVVSVQTLFDTNFDGTGDRPTTVEARSDAYTALIADSQGLLWYSYYRGRALPALWSTAEEVAREVDTLAPILTAPPVSQTVQARVLSGPAQSPEIEGRRYDSIQLLQKTHADTHYIFAVNLAEAPVAVRFEGVPGEAEGVRVLFEARTLQVAGAAFRDEFSPSAVHIYEVLAR